MDYQHLVVTVAVAGSVPEPHTSLCRLIQETHLIRQCARAQLETTQVAIVGQEHIARRVPTTLYSVTEDITVVSMD